MSHVTEEQRYTIFRMLKMNKNQTEIVFAIGKDKSVVSREISRNKDKRSGEYRPDLAQRKYNQRLIEKPKVLKFTLEVKSYVEGKLIEKWSPEQISLTPNDQELTLVSPERIYQHIAQDKKLGGSLYKNLRRKKKYKRRCSEPDNRGKIINGKSIKERPKIVDEKTKVGDLEVGLILGKNHKGAILTINDRLTGKAWLRLLKTKKATTVANEIIKALAPFKNNICTITSDNGKEFAYHEKVSKALGIDFYFAEPYSSWQRGANENLNGLIRQYFPKKTNFEQLTWREIKMVAKMLNKRPRKRLGYKTPEENFILLTSKVAFAA